MLVNFLKSSTYKTHIQLFKYAIVGGIAFLFDFGVLIFLTSYLKVFYLYSAAIGFLVGIIVNYFLSVIVGWVFIERRFSSRILEFTIYLFVGLMGLMLNEFLMWIFTDLLDIYYAVSKVISTFFVYLWNFFVRKFLLFSR